MLRDAMVGAGRGDVAARQRAAIERDHRRRCGMAGREPDAIAAAEHREVAAGIDDRAAHARRAQRRAGAVDRIALGDPRQVEPQPPRDADAVAGERKVAPARAVAGQHRVEQSVARRGEAQRGAQTGGGGAVDRHRRAAAGAGDRGKVAVRRLRAYHPVDMRDRRETARDRRRGIAAALVDADRHQRAEQRPDALDRCPLSRPPHPAKTMPLVASSRRTPSVTWRADSLPPEMPWMSRSSRSGAPSRLPVNCRRQAGSRTCPP